MADVTAPRRGERRDRAQLLLVGALALAVVFLSLSLLLNSVIYTQNLATRQTNADVSEATTFRFEVVDALGGAIEQVNRGDAVDFGARRTDYRDATDALIPMLANYSATAGVVADVDRDSVRQGTRLADGNYSNGLVPQNATGGRWWVATDSKVRNVQLRVNVSTIDSGDDVRLVFDGRRITIERVGGTARIHVENAGPDPTCRLTDGRIDVSGAWVDGSACPALATLSLADNQNVSIVNGDQVEGTFSLVVDRRETGLRTAVDAANYPDQCSPPSPPTYNDSDAEHPYTAPAIYAATANISVRTQRLTYRRSVRAAPGEAGDPPTEPTFTSFEVSPTGSGFDVKWETTDPNGDVDHVDIRFYNMSTDTVDATRLDEDPDGSVTVSASIGNLSAYYINATAVDGSSTRQVSEIRHVDGDAGCPP
ncbi:MAG: hypothetical protein ABEI80_05630 [Haloplanus sp.]